MGTDAFEVEKIVCQGTGPMAVIALNAPSGRGHYRRLISCEVFEDVLSAYFLSFCLNSPSVGAPSSDAAEADEDSATGS